MPKKIPTVIQNYNMYSEGNRMLGVTGAVTLPTIKYSTIDLTGTGILGALEEVVFGDLEKMEMKIPFRAITNEPIAMLSPLRPVCLTLRGSLQNTDISNDSTSVSGVRIVVRGKAKEFSPGNFEKAKEMNTEVTLSVSYFLIEIQGETVLEIDQLNCKMIINGVDVMSESNKYC